MDIGNQDQNQLPPNMGRKLYKSSHDKVLDGVCAGLGEYLGISPFPIRLLWAALTISSGFFGGIIIYIIASLIIPRNPEGDPGNFPEDHGQRLRELTTPVVNVLGSGLILIGLYYLLRNFDLIPYEIIDMSMFYLRKAFFPVLLIAAGVFLIFYRGKK